MSDPVIRWVRPGLNDRARAEALGALSPVERQRYQSAPPARRDSFLAGRLVLRRLAAELTGASASEVEIVASCPDCGGPHGKPVLVGSPLQLSLSHSSGAVVAAASWDAPVGIDVECGAQPAESLAAIGAITGVPSLENWIRVEAILKADGRGLRVDPQLVMIDAVSDHLEGAVADRPARYRLDDFELEPGLRVSVAVGLPPLG